MKRLEKLKTAFIITLGAKQPAGTTRLYADLVIGGLLVVLAISGLAV
jgi:hypothetical protein